MYEGHEGKKGHTLRVVDGTSIIDLIRLLLNLRDRTTDEPHPMSLRHPRERNQTFGA
jgi:hypothetical protein